MTLSMLLVGAAALSAGADDAPPRVTVTPNDTGEALVNPGMGWVLYYYDQHMGRYGSRLAAHDTVDDFPGVSTIYMAIPWAFLEPREGRYDWSVIDTPAQRWIAKGKRIALRFPCCEPCYEYATPKWVADAGAAFHRFATVERHHKWYKESLDFDVPKHCYAPDYADEVFLARHGAFLAAAARRYDGNPHVAYVDVGSFGTWGEGHTSYSGGQAYGPEVRMKHLELYARHFTRTLLVAGDDFMRVRARGRRGRVEHKGLIDRAVELGMALRDDSVMVGKPPRVAESEKMARRFWPRRPVILEPAHYGMAVRWWRTWGDGSGYLESIERYHASYAGVHWWPREFLKENRELIDRVNRRLGYRIQLREASWPREVAVGRPWTLRTTWRNAGVAPCLPGGRPAVTLKDRKGGIVAVLTIDGFDVRALPVGKPGKAEDVAHEADLAISPTLRVGPGTYDLLISVGAADGTPRIALPLPADDGDRRYRLGEITVTEPPKAP